MTNEALKPCPFCGGEAELIIHGNNFTKKRKAEIKCKKCHVSIIVGAIRFDVDWCVKEAIAAWNKRKDAK
jgi:Lar family restriction alleviation protein